ncbi:glycosyltransferase [Patescibacteria group bacterium]|nr:glycosyltransferase [Patescibacteria group bacterium]
MFQRNKKIVVVVPCYNEALGIQKVLKAFPHKDFSKIKWCLEVIVVDNNSTDDTGKIAEEHGASVLVEKMQGKGHALLSGLKNIPDDASYVVMIDGDNTYHPKELLRMIEPLDSGFCDAILGSRIQGKMKEGSMNITSRIGNWMFSFLVRYLYKSNVTDVLTGYFAWKKEALDLLLPHIKSTGFEVEMEMITKMSRLGMEVYSVPISYHPRMGQSKLNHFKDGLIIMKTLFSNLNWSPQKDNDTTRPEPYRHFAPKVA